MAKATPKQWLFVLSMLLAGWVGGPLMLQAYQQMYSGGAAVNVTNATLATTQSGVWSSRTQDGAGTAITSTGGALDMNIKSGSISNTAFGVNAGTAKIGITYPYTSCGTTAFTAALQAAPTVSTAITASTTCLLTLNLTNTTAGALTITVSDNAGTPVNFLNAVTINAGETRTYIFPNGSKFTSGVKMLASGAGINYSAEGLQ